MDMDGKAQELLDELRWLAMFADVRSQDDSKTFARVNRGALRTIRDRANSAIAKAMTHPHQPKGESV